MMIDSGASHCFITQSAVERLKLPVSTTQKIGVRPGDGHRTETQGMCKGISIVFPTLIVSVD